MANPTLGDLAAAFLRARDIQSPSGIAFRDRLDSVEAHVGSDTKYVWISPAACQIDTTAVVTRSVTNNIDRIDLDAGDETAFIWAGLPLVLDSDALTGMKLTRIDVYYELTTEALDAATATINEVTLPANGSAMTGAAVTSTDVLPLTVDQHTGTITVDTPVFLDGATNAYSVGVLFDKKATTLFSFLGFRLVLEVV